MHVRLQVVSIVGLRDVSKARKNVCQAAKGVDLMYTFAGD